LNIEQLTWTASILVTLSIVAPYFLLFRRRRHLDLERKAEASQLGIDRPTGQYPWVDPTACIGCGSCVLACRRRTCSAWWAASRPW
jgi:NAD-dependent dihydropyrimidine dehydrogenase PreA subunit